MIFTSKLPRRQHDVAEPDCQHLTSKEKGLMFSQSFRIHHKLRLSVYKLSSAKGKTSRNMPFRRHNGVRFKTQAKQKTKTIMREPKEQMQEIVRAASWVVYDMKEGKAIGQKLSYEIKEIASLTKLMTAFVCSNVLEQRKLLPTTKVTATEAACTKEGTSAQLKPNCLYTIENLLYMMLLPSGNDAAHLLGEYCGKLLYLSQRGKRAQSSQERVDLFEQEKVGLTKIYMRQFLKRMNMEAKCLRMSHSQFKNPTGLPDPNSRSNCNDLVKLCLRVLEVPLLRRICETRIYSFHYLSPQGKPVLSTIQNTNNLLDQHFKGLKTGMTSSAGGCLAALWECEGQRLLAVVLGCKDEVERFTETRKLIQIFKTKP